MWNVNFNGENQHGMHNWHQDYFDMPVSDLVAEVVKDGDCDQCPFDWANAVNTETGEELDIYRDGTYQVL